MKTRWQGGPEDRTERIEVRLTRSDKAACEQHARAAGMSLSKWVRSRLLLDLPVVPAENPETFPATNPVEPR